MHAVPKAPPTSANISAPRKKEPAKSRLAKLRDEKRRPHLPDPGLQYLVDDLIEIGPASTGGFGPAPITFSEIRAWQQATSARLTPWEARTLRLLSVEYIAQMQISEDPNCPAPDAEISSDARESVAKKIDELL